MEITNKSILPNYKKAKALALDLIDKYNIHKPIVDIFMICEKEGLKVEYFKSERNSKEYEIDGAFFRKENKILINSTRPAKQVAFILAHELGHAVMHTDVERDILLRNGKSSSADYLEKKANKFAACLLMPEHMIKQEMDKWGLSSTHTPILANLFGVPLSAMNSRLKNLKWK
jgi:Zn-dependent peptidase ImmA (M78 family)